MAFDLYLSHRFCVKAESCLFCLNTEFQEAAYETCTVICPFHDPSSLTIKTLFEFPCWKGQLLFLFVFMDVPNSGFGDKWQKPTILNRQLKKECIFWWPQHTEMVKRGISTALKTQQIHSSSFQSVLHFLLKEAFATLGVLLTLSSATLVNEHPLCTR